MRERQAEPYEFQATLVYIASSRPPSATEWFPVLKKSYIYLVCVCVCTCMCVCMYCVPVAQRMCKNQPVGVFFNEETNHSSHPKVNKGQLCVTTAWLEIL